MTMMWVWGRHLLVMFACILSRRYFCVGEINTPTGEANFIGNATMAEAMPGNASTVDANRGKTQWEREMRGNLSAMVQAENTVSVSQVMAGHTRVEAMTTLLWNLTDSYSTNVRPGLDGDPRLRVKVAFTLLSLSEVNEVKSYITLLGYLSVSWTDERMSWEPADYVNISHVYITTPSVWVPPVIVGNPSEKVSFYRESNTDVKYDHTGVALWMPGSVSQTFCSMNVYLYPFDTQQCSIMIVAEGVQSSEINLTHAQSDIRMEFHSEHCEWEIMETWTSSEIALDDMTILYFNLKIKRKPYYLIMNLLCPLASLSFLSIMTFLIPPDSGERISFSVTVFLSYSVFITLLGQSVPQVSDPIPLICFYIVSLLLLSGAVTTLAIINIRLYHTPGNRTLPLCFQVIARCLTKCCIINNKSTNYNEHTDNLGTEFTKRAFEDGLDIALPEVDGIGYSAQAERGTRPGIWPEVDGIRYSAQAERGTRPGIWPEVDGIGFSQAKRGTRPGTWRDMAHTLDVGMFCFFFIVNSLMLVGILWKMLHNYSM